MIRFIKISLMVCLFVVFVAAGCSGEGDAVTPEGPVQNPAQVQNTGVTTGLWGSWQVSVDKAAGEFSILKLREADLALNVLGFLEPPALVNMTIDFGTLTIDLNNRYIGVDVILKHPFITAKNIFNGFDVRGIVFGPRLENADGLTKYFNPDDFTGIPYGYIDGLLGEPDALADFAGEFNGYKYFANNISLDGSVADYYTAQDNLDNRGMFSEGETLSRHYDLRFGGDYADPMVFNYAIAASFNWPEGDPPFSLDDFIVSTANQAEPVFIVVNETYNSLHYNPDNESGGGSINLEIELFDWHKPVNPEDLSIEAPGVIDATQAAFVAENGPNMRTYSVSADGEPITTGELEIIFSVTTEKTYGECYFMDLMPELHPLYSDPIEVKFLHKTLVEEGDGWPYIDQMDSTTENLWTIENGPAHNTYMTWGQAGTEWQANGGNGSSVYYLDYMETYLVSKIFKAPPSGEFTMILTHKYYTESWRDDGNIAIRYEGQPWMPVYVNPAGFTGQTPGWPADYVEDMFTVSVTPGMNFQIGFRFFSDYSVAYYGWFIDHLILTLNMPPDVSAVDGKSIIGNYGSETYSVSAADPDNLTYSWSVELSPAAPVFDDPGNGDGTIDINWTIDGIYTVVCSVTDDGDPNMSTVSGSLEVIVDDTLPGIDGPSENFETWPPGGWTFADHTVAGTGNLWGQANIMSTCVLDADGADDTCYCHSFFEEARWNNVTIPATGNAVLRITHSIWSEGYTSGNFCDGGMLFIDDTLIYDSDCLYGLAPGHHLASDYWWTPNTYMPTYPGSTLNYGWAGRYPDEDNWQAGFAVSIMDISSYADGGQHDFSFVFHSDAAVSCESGGDYHSWLIDRVEIFYE